jgi:hypothetical protein
MKKFKRVSLVLSLFSVLCILPSVVYAALGNTTVCKWKDNKTGAFNMAFDGDYDSARRVAMPMIIQRDLPVSLYYNPGLDRYASGIDFWETAPNRYGWTLGHHQMECKNGFWEWGDMVDAHYQVGEAARIIWSIKPPGSTQLHIMTEWPEGSSGGLSTAQWDELIADYHFIRCSTVMGGRYLMPDASWSYSQLIARPQSAMNGDSFTGLLFHQIGQYGEYGYVVDETYFEQFLDFLVANEDTLWVGNDMDIWSYMQEYATRNVENLEATASIVRLNLTSNMDTSLYIYPLTLITEVSTGWSYCKVTQGTIDAKKIYPVNSGTVMYEAIPGHGEIKLESASQDMTPPSTPVVSDGLGADIDSTAELHQIQANWTQSSDNETGIKKYWYKIGTTPGGSQLMDWIDNGLALSTTETRTHLSLSRGVTYYFAVKAVNGVGLESGVAVSNGQCVDIVPGYVKFSDDFEDGDTATWSSASGVTVTNGAANTGSYGLDFSPSGRVTRNNVNSTDDLYVGFSFKLASNFSLTSGAINIMSITNASGDTVATFDINYDSVGYLLSCLFRTDPDATYTSGLWKNVPCSPGSSFAPGILPVISKDTWYRLDIHTRSAGNKKGGVEIWLDGAKIVSSLSNYNTTLKAARHVSLSMSGASGNIYMDDVTMSDSLMSGFVAAVEDDTPPGDIAWINDGTTPGPGGDIDSTDSTTQLSANWAQSTDNESGISGYKYAIGDTPGSTGVVSWTNTNGTSVTRTGLTLTVGKTYYFSVKAVNWAGLESNPINSDGQLAEEGSGSGLPGDDINVKVYPSPYNPSAGSSMRFSVGDTTGGEVKIYTLSGKLVKELLIGAGESEVDWDVLNEDGNSIATGLYLYTITDSDGNKKTGKLAIGN